MKRYAVLAAAIAFVMTPVCSAETWRNVPIVDVTCAAKVKASPDAHTRDCALSCAKSGFGIVTSDGSFLKLDAQGNDKALAALRATGKKDHLRVTIDGSREGQTIKVASLEL